MLATIALVIIVGAVAAAHYKDVKRVSSIAEQFQIEEDLVI